MSSNILRYVTLVTLATATSITSLDARVARPTLDVRGLHGSVRTPSSVARLASAPTDLRTLAHSYYAWRNHAYPVASSDQGMHDWDDRLTDYSVAAIADRRARVRRLLAQVRAMRTTSWARDDRVDWILFRSQLERAEFYDRVIRSEETDPQTYVGECSNAIFSLLKKEYAAPSVRARAALARLRGMPALLAQGRRNLTRPVKLYSQLAISAARGGDELYTVSMMQLAADLPAAERAQLVVARDSALHALHDFAGWLEGRMPTMAPWTPMGEANYNYMLHHIYLLPLDASQLGTLGEVELARYRALEALLPDPSLASPDPSRLPNIPKDQEEFLTRFQARQQQTIDFLRDNHLVTIPPYVGQFSVRQLPEAFKPTSPGGFMNPPGLYDTDNSGFYFVPTYNPQSRNFYIRAGIEDPRPLLGHEGLPGHFLQISIANHLTDEIRREHGDGVFVEGWALYGEEMLTRTGYFAAGSAAAGQVLRLSRYRAARVGVDVNLHSGRWDFEQAVRYFMDAGGLDREAAEGEAAGAASSPTQKMTYIVGKFQIMRLLGRYRDQQGAAFTLGKFHDQLISYGSLPLSVVEWLMLNDSSSLDRAMR